MPETSTLAWEILDIKGEKCSQGFFSQVKPIELNVSISAIGETHSKW